MPFDSTPIQPNPYTPRTVFGFRYRPQGNPIQPNPYTPGTDQWGDYNLELLASYLATGETEHRFSMNRYGSALPIDHVRARAACAAGHLPYATHVEPKHCEGWPLYIGRLINLPCTSANEQLWLFIFGSDWAFLKTLPDGSIGNFSEPTHAADRIAFTLDNKELVLRYGDDDFSKQDTIPIKHWLDYFAKSGRQPGKLEGYEYPPVAEEQTLIHRRDFTRPIMTSVMVPMVDA